VTHIDDSAIHSLTCHYDAHLPKAAAAHLDLCSSWVSFLPEGYGPAEVVGLGMNKEELVANKQVRPVTRPTMVAPAWCPRARTSCSHALLWRPFCPVVTHSPPVFSDARRAPAPCQLRQLTSSLVHDLNLQPALPYADGSFDAITCVVSVDYLSSPLVLFAEMKRVLRPGGIAVMSFRYALACFCASAAFRCATTAFWPTMY
jgi:hypothetical protein